MSLFFKRVVLLVSMLTVLFVGSAYASGFHYGEAKKAGAVKTLQAANYSQVVIRNYTPYTYTAYITFRNSGKNVVADLGPYDPGSLYWHITLDIEWPDFDACATIYRKFDGLRVADECHSFGFIEIK